MTYDIFISYKRRGTSSATAAYLYELLIKKGYNVFFDRKEMRSGKFDEQLLEHITNAQDIIILLEETSLASCFSEIEDYYQTDWFCREVMHTLSFKDKNVIPLLLNGYTMPDADVLPPELKELPRCQALPLDITEVEEMYQKYFVDREYLKSKPKNLAISRQYQNKGAVVGSFLFYTDAASCELYECGEHIITLTDDNDEDHAFRYPVTFAGEHRFLVVNNDTCEELRITKRIETNCQEYVNIAWTETRSLWERTKEEITQQADAGTLVHWGKCLLEGNQVHSADFDRAYQCLCRAESIDKAATDNIFANAYHKVLDANATYEAQYPWIVKAVEQNDPFAIFYLGKMYDQGLGVKKNRLEGLHYYSLAADMGNAKAMNNLAGMYRDGKVVEQDLQRAFQLYQKAADGGSSYGYWNIGNFYLKGIYVNQDYEKAFQYYEKAAAENNVSAVLAIAKMYSLGQYVEKNEETAVEWLQKAVELAKQNNSTSTLGIAYRRIAEYYDESKHDYTTAIENYEKSCQAGSVFGMSGLGIMYEEGRGTEPNPAKAVELYLQALQKKPSHCRALYRLASCYERGCGVVQDLDKARQLYQQLVDQVDDYSVEAVEALKRLPLA